MEWLLFSLLAALLMGFGLILDKYLLSHGHSLDFALVLSGTTFMLLLIGAFFMNVVLSPGLIFFGALIGVTHAVGLWFLFKTIHHSEVSSASVFVAFAPLFVFIFSILLLHEELGPLQLLGLLLIIGGAYALRSQLHGKSLLDPLKSMFKGKSSFYAFFFLSFFAISFVISRYIIISFEVSPFSVTLVSQWFSLLVIGLLFVIFHHDRVPVLITTFKKSFWFILLVSVLGIGEILAGLYAMKYSNGFASMVSGIKRLGLLFPVLLGGGLFHEKNILKKGVAIIIMIGGSLLLAWSR